MPNPFQKLPPLNALVAFEAAFRLRNFTRAADELALSQASISRRIRELELDLGVQLFERRRYDVVPTEEGETLAAAVRPSLGELATTADGLRNRGLGKESLTIFSDLSLANALVVPVLGEFQRLFPDLRLRVLASYEAIEAVREDFDIGLQYGAWGDDKFLVEPIADDAIFPVCSPQLASRLPSPVSPVELAKQPLLHMADLGRRWPDWRNFLAFFRLKEPEPNEGLVFSSYQICLDVAEKGEGIALGWARSVQARLDAGHLVRLQGMTMPLVNIVNLHRPKRARQNLVADRFVHLLRSRIEPVG